MQIIIYIFVGFIAQMIDGALGMAYGVSSNTFLRLTGVSSAISSFCVHISEVFTTLVSGISHLKLKNVDKKLMLRLVIPGVLGGIIGAFLLSEFNNPVIDLLIDVYLIIMGIIIISKIFKKSNAKQNSNKFIYGLGLAGGFSDALGGGGWGTIVNSTLIASGNDVQKTIGTANTAEFFVTIAETATFFMLLGNYKQYFTVIVGLIVGGIIAAPFGAILCKKLPTKVLLGIVGIVTILLNIIKLTQHINLIF